MKHTNALINETSPYLLQHAHNPVNWYAWHPETLQRAVAEDKLLLISIGYSTCHWCHVMEHESFEDEQIAKLMNENFICIKVDREERPDIDAVYMQAVQLMTGQGGWPLNCIAMPDGRPFYGGTYFPKLQWKNILTQLSNLWKNEPGRCNAYSDELTSGIKKAELINASEIDKKEISANNLAEAVERWSSSFDKEYGGPNRAPKFAMPVNLEFLLRYSYHTGSEKILKHVFLTLDKMALGGIYDHIGGGFARYSTDIYWKVPHFEKMLYDNAQLISLYSNAFKFSKKNLYKSIVEETFEFVKSKLTDTSGGFYSALDADTEGVEGKFYVWKKEELQRLLGKNADLFFDVFNINDYGYWEHDNYVLIKDKEDAANAAKHNMTLEQFNEDMAKCKKGLLEARNSRTRPGLDNKMITSWNALMIKGCCDAYSSFHDKKFIDAAIQAIHFLEKHLWFDENKLKHSTHPGIISEENHSTEGFLDAYAFTIEAYLSLYQCTLNEDYLNKSEKLMTQVINSFYDESTGMCYFTSASAEKLIVRKFETEDNVIPASNSSMAHSLFLLSRISENGSYLDIAKKMLQAVSGYALQYPSGFSNWLRFSCNFIFPFHEIAITGKNSHEVLMQFIKNYLPNCIVTGSEKESYIALLRNRLVKDKTLIYVCRNQSCLLPVETAEEGLVLVKK